jgi:hypothetical protein
VCFGHHQDAKTGQILGAAFSCDIPEERVKQAAQQAEVVGDEVYKVD